MGKEKINEQIAQDLLDELEQEKKHDEDWIKWYNEQHYNNTHPTMKTNKKPKIKHSKPQKQAVRGKGEKNDRNN